MSTQALPFDSLPFDYWPVPTRMKVDAEPPESQDTIAEQAQFRTTNFVPLSGEVAIVSTGKTDFEANNLRARLFSLNLPKHLAAEGAETPTMECRVIAAEIAIGLLSDHGLYPQLAAANVEDGISLVYQNHIANTTMVIEAYNTAEVAAVLSRSKTIIAAEDIRIGDTATIDRFVELLKGTGTAEQA